MSILGDRGVAGESLRQEREKWTFVGKYRIVPTSSEDELWLQHIVNTSV